MKARVVPFIVFTLAEPARPLVGSLVRLTAADPVTETIWLALLAVTLTSPA